MSSHPLVSVVVPTYNRPQSLAVALDSVSAQTFRDWECLVCDDGSSEETLALVRARSATDPRFRLVTGRRYGLPAGPRNRGIAQARGEWIAFLDDDDLWHPRKLELQLEEARREPADAIGAEPVYFRESDGPPPWTPAADAPPVLPIGLRHILLQRDPYPCTPSNVIRRDRLVEVGGFAESRAYRAVEDYDLWTRLLALPGLRWRVLRGATLVVARDAGSDSISAWNAQLRPDVVRQRWAMLEILCRRITAAPPMPSADRRELLAHALRGADDCANRSRLLGWRGPSALGYLIAAGLALRLGRIGGAAIRVVRLFRFGLGGAATQPSPIDDWTPTLVRRTLGLALAVLTGRRRTVEPIPVDPPGPHSRMVEHLRETPAVLRDRDALLT